jgi:beta-phosphoglucomutase-like phosphatase (HAD superfamily)
LHAVRELGREPAACAAIEDSSNGMRSATAAGLVLIAAPRPDYPPAEDALAPAALVIDGIDALTTEAIESLG